MEKGNSTNYNPVINGNISNENFYDVMEYLIKEARNKCDLGGIVEIRANSSLSKMAWYSSDDFEFMDAELFVLGPNTWREHKNGYFVNCRIRLA